MRVGRDSRRAQAGPSSPEPDTAHPEGTALDASPPHDAARRPGSQGDQAGGRQPAPADAVPDLDSALDLARGGDEAGFTVLWRDPHPPPPRHPTGRGNDAPPDPPAGAP